MGGQPVKMKPDMRHGDNAKDAKYVTDLVSGYYDSLK